MRIHTLFMSLKTNPEINELKYMDLSTLGPFERIVIRYLTSVVCTLCEILNKLIHEVSYFMLTYYSVN
jgi:hypothetical protein